MAVVYEIMIVKPESENVGDVLSEVELVDSTGDLDEWHTDMQVSKRVVGPGSGSWIVRQSQKSILLLDDNGGHIEARLFYTRWPLRKGDEGDVELRTPFKTKGGETRMLKFAVERVS